MKNIDFKCVRLNDGFWKKKQDMVRSVTVYTVYNRFLDTGRISAFRCDWKEGKGERPHYFWDSDVAKWIEAVGYLCAERREAELEALADDIIESIERNQDECGYFNIYFTVVEPNNRFKSRECHELYTAGHLIEAAIAYCEGTGKDKLLRCVVRLADYIYKVFITDRSAGFVTPGHEEIELALYRLYEYTGCDKYRQLADFFIENRGASVEEHTPGCPDPSYDFYVQSHIRPVEQTEAVGHAVRGVYLYSAMADYARINKDEKMKSAACALFDNIRNKKMYITGGIGQSAVGESFTIDYDLPNATAYAESCAAIGLMLFSGRMQVTDGGKKYADTIERILYNGFLSSISLDGKSFFYENPLELPPPSMKLPGMHYPITSRVEVFQCSCCPPNIARFVPTVTSYLYTTDGDTVYVNQYMPSVAEFDGCTIEQITSYPSNGVVTVRLSGAKKRIKLRIPEWCDCCVGNTNDGYLTVDMKDGDEYTVDFKMKVKFVTADPRVTANAGRVALTYGPTVFCLESADNGTHLNSIILPPECEPTLEQSGDMMHITCPAYRILHSDSLYSSSKPEYESIRAVFIPYRAFANRGDGEMLVWVRRM